MPSVVISVEAAYVDKNMFRENLTSEVMLEEPEIGSTDPNIPIDNNCTHDKLHYTMPRGSGDYKADGDECDECYASPTARQQRWPATELERFEVGTSDVDKYEGEDGDHADADEEEEPSLANDESTLNVKD